MAQVSSQGAREAPIGGTHGELAADARMDAGVGHEALLPREVEERAVRNARLLRARPWVRGPRIEVGVEVNHRDWAINLVQGAKDGKDNGVISAQAARSKVDSAERSVGCARAQTNLTMRGCSFPSFENLWVTELTPGASALAGVRANKVEYATSIWSTARALSNGLTGI